jgi:hypothetical protein
MKKKILEGEKLEDGQTKANAPNDLCLPGHFRINKSVCGPRTTKNGQY